MALLDTDEDVVVVRIAYDGPPESGKTTSVNALARRLSKDVYCPEELDGRTAYFDWMDYTGGRFEGRRIRCQIVSVPGQRELSERREWLLGDADAIVFVANTMAEHLEESLEYLRELPSIIGNHTPPIGVVLQANKRDQSDAVELKDVHRLVADIHQNIAIVESTATTGTGIRESFVFAVRLALDRVREFIATDTLPNGTGNMDGKALFAEMQSKLTGKTLRKTLPHVVTSTADKPVSSLQNLLSDVIRESEAPTPTPAATSVAAALLAIVEPVETEATPPDAPTATVPSGAIWPPVQGRVILHKATQSGLQTTTTLEEDFWSAGLGTDWQVCSRANAIYSSFEVGRAALVAWARFHVASSAFLSKDRCIVLSQSGSQWRLWQLVHSQNSLYDKLKNVARLRPEDGLVAILNTARLLMCMANLLASSSTPITCSLRSVGLDANGGPILVGLMPEPGSTLNHGDHTSQIDSELREIVDSFTQKFRLELSTTLQRSHSKLALQFEANWVDRVARLLVG